LKNNSFGKPAIFQEAPKWMKGRPLILRLLIDHGDRRGHWSLSHSLIPKWRGVPRTGSSSDAKLCGIFMDEGWLLGGGGMKSNLISRLCSREPLSKNERRQMMDRTNPMKKRGNRV